jgi:hypothetical protein
MDAQFEAADGPREEQGKHVLNQPARRFQQNETNSSSGAS